MAALLRKPGLDPTKIPTVPVELDTDHPLAQGLVTRWIPGLSLCDFSGLGDGAVPSGTGSVVGSERGPGAHFGANYWIGKIPFNLPVVTLVMSYRCTNTTVADQTIFAGLTDGPLSGTYATDFEWQNGDGLHFYIYDGSALRPSLPTGINASDGRVHRAVGTYSSSFLASLYFDGSLQATQQGSAAAFASYSVPGLALGSTAFAQGDASLAFDCFDLMIFARAWSPADVAWDAAEPYGMLRPIVRRTWFVPAASGSSNALGIAASASELTGDASGSQVNGGALASGSGRWLSTLSVAAANAATLAAARHEPTAALALSALDTAAVAAALETVGAALGVSAGTGITLLPVFGTLGVVANAGAADAAAVRGVVQALAGTISGGGQALALLGGIGALRAALALSAAGDVSLAPVLQSAGIAFSLGAGNDLTLAGRAGFLTGTISGGGIGLIVLGGAGAPRATLALSAAEAVSILGTAGAAMGLRGEAGNNLALSGGPMPAAGVLRGLAANLAPVLGRLGLAAGALSGAASNGMILAPAAALGIGAIRAEAANIGALDGFLATLESAISAGADGVVLVGSIGDLSAALLLGVGVINPAIVLTGQSVVRIFGRSATDRILGRSAIDRIFAERAL